MAETENFLIKKFNTMKKSITMLDVKIIMALLILFSQYFKINSSKLALFLQRCFCICSTVLAVLLYFFLYLDYLIESDAKGLAVNTIVTIEFLLCSFISQITGHAYISTFIREVVKSDSIMGHPTKVFTLQWMFKLIMFSLCLGLTSLLIDLFQSEFWSEMFARNGHRIFALLSNQYMMMSIDLSSFKIILTVGLLQNRLKMLRKTLEENSIPDNFAEMDEVRTKLSVVEKCSQNYRILLDAFDDVYGHLQLAMFLVIMFEVPRLIMFGYSFLKQIIYHKYTARIIIVDAVRYLARTIAPCVICEVCYQEVDQLKILLTKQIIQSSDDEFRAHLQRFLEYISHRPFNFVLLRAVRVDIQLPVTIVAFAATYIILLIEFTHFVL